MHTSAHLSAVQSRFRLRLNTTAAEIRVNRIKHRGTVGDYSLAGGCLQAGLPYSYISSRYGIRIAHEPKGHPPALESEGTKHFWTKTTDDSPETMIKMWPNQYRLQTPSVLQLKLERTFISFVPECHANNQLSLNLIPEFKASFSPSERERDREIRPLSWREESELLSTGAISSYYLMSTGANHWHNARL